MQDKLKKQIDRYAAALGRAEKAQKKLSQARLLSFAFILVAFFASITNLYFLSIVLLFSALFFFFVQKSNKVKARLLELHNKIAFLKENILRLSSAWKKELSFNDPQKMSSLARDLNLLGKESLMHKFALRGSPFGARSLEDAVHTINNIDKSTALRRQQIVQAFSKKALRRRQFFALIRENNWQEKDIRSFEKWLKKEDADATKLWFFRAFALLFLVNFIAAIFLNTAIYVFAQFLLHLALVQIFHGKWQAFYLEGLSKETSFSVFAKLFSFVQLKYRNERHLLDHSLPNVNLYRAFSDFENLNEKLSLVYSGMGYALINALVFYDAWYIPKIIKWKSNYRNIYSDFFLLLGELEQYESLANAANLNPDYNYPIFLDKKKLIAEKLAHPLIDKESVVANDLALREGEILLITGSNMSGKTTFLRCVSVAAFMAYLGLPTAAKRLELAIFNLASSITIADSLSDGVSFFYAEVKQLREILELAKSGKPMLYLIDEMLKGTNVRERNIACEKVIRQLLQTEAIGLFSTHDLELTKLADSFKDKLKNMHFAEKNSADKLSFDFKLKQGVVQSSNALAILEREGLI
jgi:hypothetical protein